MVAIITGKGAGIENSSVTLLGAKGQVGTATTGKSGEGVYVNGTTGNLVLTTVDELLVGRGPDAVVSRTYNSLGAWDGDNSDYWRASPYRRITVPGTWGSGTVTRTDWDGSESIYTWQSSYSYAGGGGAYVSKDGDGAYDYIVQSGADYKWVDGNTQINEVYGSNGLIKSRNDLDGNSVTYGYNGAGLLTTVTNGSESTTLYYGTGSGTDLLSLNTSTADGALIRVFYEYNAGRLSKVKVNLTPSDGVDTVTGGNPATYNYETSYTYKSNTSGNAGFRQVATIAQSDGALLEFDYDGSGRVLEIREAIAGASSPSMRKTAIAYSTVTYSGTSHNLTTITDALGQVTKLISDTDGFLKSAELPPSGTFDPAPAMTFTWTDGDVATMTAAGNTVSYHYTNGNRDRELDSLGNSIVRTFGSKNELLTETRFTGLDTDGLTGSEASGAMVTRYTYDYGSNRLLLRFVTDATGLVTEYRYNSYGQRTATLAYAPATAPTSVDFSSMTSWISGKTVRERVETSYDLRGNVRETVSYAELNPDNTFKTASARSRTVYIYSAHGELLSKYTEGNGGYESFAYDGLGRTISTGNFNNPANLFTNPNATSFWSASNASVTQTGTLESFPAMVVAATNTSGSGVASSATASVAVGEKMTLTILLRAGTVTSASVGLSGTTNFWGNNADSSFKLIAGPGTVTQTSGGLFQVTGLSSSETTVLSITRTYQAAENARATIYVGTTGGDAAGDSITLANPLLVRTAQAVSGITYTDATGGSTVAVTLLNGLVRTSTYDRAGNLVSVGESGTDGARTTSYLYDKVGRLRVTTSPEGLNSYIFYDGDGRRTGDIDGDGTVTEYRYDAAGRIASTTRYATRLTTTQTAAILSSGALTDVSFASLRPAATSDDRWSWTFYDLAGRTTRTIDGDGSVVTYDYDGASRLTSTTALATRMTSTALDALKAMSALPNLYTNPGSASLWSPSNASVTVTGTIAGFPALTLAATNTSGSGAVTNTTFAVNSGDTRTVTIILKKGVVTTASVGLVGTTTWTGSSSSESTAAIVSGPGTLTRTSNALFQVTGLDTEPTIITITRTYTTSEQARVVLYVGTTAGDAVSDSILFANPYLYTPVTPSLPSLPSTSSGDRTARNFYDDAGRLIGALDAEGYVSKVEYDVAGRKVHTIARKTKPTTTTGSFATIFASASADDTNDIHNWWVYDSRGLLRGTIDGEGTLTRLDYSAPGYLTRQETGQKLSGSGFTTLPYSAPPKFADLATTSGALYSSTVRTFDNSGRVLSEVVALKDSATSTTSYSYDVIGNLVATVTQPGGADARTYTRRYDQFGRLTGELSAYGAAQLAANPSNATQIYNDYGSTYTYNKDDLLISSTAPGGVKTLYYYNSDGALVYEVQQVGTKGQVTGHSYNAFGQRSDTVVYATQLASLTGMTGGYATSQVTTALSVASALDSARHWDFNTDGGVKQVTDALGYVTTYTYNGFGELETTVAPLDDNGTSPPARTVTTALTYDKRGLLKTETVGGTLVATYGYDAFGRTLTLQDALTGVTTSEYDRAGRLTKSTNAASKDTLYKYDARGNLVLVTQVLVPGSVEYKTHYVYDKANRRIATIDALGAVTTTTYDADGRVTATRAYINTVSVGGLADEVTESSLSLPSADDSADHVTRFAYNTDGQLRFTMDSLRHVTENVYDVRGNVIRTIAYDGAIAADGTGAYAESYIAGRIDTQGLASAAGTRVTRSVYDEIGQLTFAIDALGQVTRFTYDAKGQLVSKIEFVARYTASDNPTADYMQVTWQPANTASGDRLTRAYYDRKGQLRYSVDALGYVTRTDFNKAGQVVKTSRYADVPTSGTISDTSTISALDTYYTSPPSSTRTTLFDYDAKGRLFKTTDPEGYVTQLTLDDLGRITESAEAYGTGAVSITKYEYDALSRVVKETRGYTADEASTSWFFYDAVGNRAATVDGENYLTVWTYDAVGNVIADTRYMTALTSTYLTAGIVTSPTAVASLITGAGTGKAAYSIYDALGQQRASVDREKYLEVSTYDADGNVVSDIEYASPVSLSMSLAYANMGSLSALQGAAGASVHTDYTYNSFHEVTKTVDARGNDSYAIYDKLGRVSRQIDAERYVTDTVYTRGGQIESVTRRQVGANQWAYSAESWLWTLSGVTRTAVSPLDTSAATKLAVSTTGTAGYATGTAGTAVVSGNKVTFTFWVKADTVSTTSFGLYGSSSAWGGNGDTSATILLGSGTLTQTGGGLWSVSGLDANGTLISVTRTYQASETATARLYAGSSTSSATAGNSVIVARPTVTTTDAVTQFTYNRRDELTGTQDAEGYTESFTLNAFGDRTASTNKLGGTTNYTYDKRGLLLTETLPVTTKNSSGTSVSVVNTYRYDERGNRTKMVEAGVLNSGGTIDTALSGVEVRTTVYTYDKLDRVTKTTHDAVSIVNNDLTTTTGFVPEETYQYDRRGNVTQSIDAAGARTRNWYDSFGNARYRLVEVEAGSGVLTYTDLSARGEAKAVTVYGDLVTLAASWSSVAPTPVSTSNARTTSYKYDRAGRVTETRVAGLRTGEFAGGSYSFVTGDVLTKVTYDPAGNVTVQEDGRGNKVYGWYDRLGRMVAQVDAEEYLTEWRRDAEGNAISETRYATQLTGFTPGAAPPTQNSHADDRITTFAYDRNGRRVAETRFNVASTSINASNGNATDAYPTSSTIYYAYNGLGQVTIKIEANDDRTDYNYDAGGRLTLEVGQAFTNHDGATVNPRTAYTYDGLNNLKTTRLQAGSTANDTDDRITTYVYGAGGRLTSVTDAAGKTRYYGYDKVGRTVRESYDRTLASGATVTEASVTRYDLAGRAITQTHARLSSSTWVFTTGASGTPAPEFDAVRTRYNAYGEVTGRGITAGPGAAAVYQEFFDYDAGGRLWRSNTGDGVIRLHFYDKAGNETLTLATLTADLSGDIVSTAVSAISSSGGLGTSGSITTSTAVTTVTVYDKRGQATHTREPGRALSSSSTSNLIVHGKAYNAFGEVTAEYDPRAYDSSGALVSGGAGYTTSFYYNTMGRLIRKVANQVSVTAENGAQSNVRPEEIYGYDLSGRLVSVRDANSAALGEAGFQVRTTRVLLAGTGHGGSEALTLKEFRNDDAKFETGYDVFGDARKLTNEVGSVQTRDYDKLGRLITQTMAQRGVGTAGNPYGSAEQLVEHYVYDELGQRTRHWNSQFGDTVLEKTDYDAQGRIVSTIGFANDTVEYRYKWETALATTGLADYDGWEKTTIRAGAPVNMVEGTDFFGRLIDRTDFGNHNYSFEFDKGGRLVARGNSGTGGGEDVDFTWYNTGLAAGQTGTQGTATYAYDVAGNRTAETFVKSSVSYRNATASYDALNRMTAWSDSGYATTANASEVWEYDANGNVRRLSATYATLTDTGTVSGSGGQEYWFKYDAMNRVTLEKGYLDGTRGSGVIRRSSVGKDIAYYADGARASILYDAQVWGQSWRYVNGNGPVVPDGTGNGHWELHSFQFAGQRREDYVYTADGYLATTYHADSYTDPGSEPTSDYATPESVYYMTPPAWHYTTSESDRDALGRIIWSKEYGGIAGWSERTSIVYDHAGRELSETSYTYRQDTPGGIYQEYKTDIANTYTNGLLTLQVQDAFKKVSGSWDDPAAADSRQTYSYAWWDGAMQSGISNDHDDNTSTAAWTTTYSFDSSGHITSAAIADERPRTVTYAVDAAGMVTSRDEELNATGDDAGPRQLRYHFAGVQIGEAGNNGTDNLEFMASTADRLKPAPTTPGLFRNGATGGTPFADFEQAYEAINGVFNAGTAQSYTVTGGESLAAIAQATWGDASLWYLIADANGLSGAESLAAGRTLILPNKVRANRNSADTWRPYDPNDALGDTSPTDAKPKKNKCGVMGTILMVAIAVAVTIVTAGATLAAMTPGLTLGQGIGAVVGTTAIGGAAAFGSAAASVTTASLVAASAVGGAIGSLASQGFGIAIGAQSKISWKSVALAGISSGIGAGLGQAGGVFAEKGFVGGALRGAAGSALTQGIGVLTGLQKNFSFMNVALAGLGGGIGAEVSRAFPGVNTTLERAGVGLVSGMAAGIANAAARTLINGSDFGDNLMAALPDVLGSTLGNLLASSVASVSDDRLRVMLREGTPEQQGKALRILEQQQQSLQRHRTAEIDRAIKKAERRGDTEAVGRLRAERTELNSIITAPRALITRAANLKFGDDAFDYTVDDTLGASTYRPVKTLVKEKHGEVEWPDYVGAGADDVGLPTEYAEPAKDLIPTDPNPIVVEKGSGPLTPALDGESTIGRVVVDTLGYSQQKVEEYGPFAKAAIVGFKTIATGGFQPVLGVMIEKGVEFGIPFLPLNILEPVALAAERGREFVGDEGGGFLLSKNSSSVNGRDSDAVAWGAELFVGVSGSAISKKAFEAFGARKAGAANGTGDPMGPHLGEVWRLDPKARGRWIESFLAKNDYSDANGWYRVGSEKRGFFRLVDFQKGQNLVSLKSVDTTGKSWLSDMESHIGDLGRNGATVNGKPANMILDMRVQPGGAAAARSLIQLGRENNVTVVIKEFK